MPKVTINETNLRHCRCPKCPVQEKSACVAKLLSTEKADKPEARLYCATSKTICTDIDPKQWCQCPSCLVWDEHNLKSTYYCTNGSADEIG